MLTGPFATSPGRLPDGQPPPGGRLMAVPVDPYHPPLSDLGPPDCPSSVVPRRPAAGDVRDVVPGPAVDDSRVKPHPVTAMSMVIDIIPGVNLVHSGVLESQYICAGTFVVRNQAMIVGLNGVPTYVIVNVMAQVMARAVTDVMARAMTDVMRNVSRLVAP